MAAGGRVSIPAGARRTVADIKEIAGGHSDEEVYAMLRECSMDPNETAQRLLLQDTFHEVKRKRDKKKEGSKEPSDTRWRPAMHGRGGKSGRGNYSSHISANFNGPAGQITLGGKENGINQITEKGSGSTPNVNTNMAAKTSTSVASLSNSASQPDDLSTVVATNCTTVCDVTKSCSTALVNFKGCLPSGGQVSVIGPNAQQSLQSASDSVLVPSLNSHSLGDVGAPKQALGRKKTSVEHNVGHDLPADSKGFFQQAGSSSFGQSSGSRPSSSYSSRSQQSCGSQKVMSNKERKAKPTSTTAPEATEKVIILDNIALAADAVPQSVPMSNSVSKDDLLKVDKSFNDLQLVAKQHVIIPDHLQVSDSEKYGLCFGSFNANFQQTMGSTDLECAKMSSLPEDKSSSSIVQEEADLACHQLPSAKLEEYSPSAVVNSSSFPTESDQCRNDSATSGVLSSYSTFELAPHSHGNEILVIEESESKVQKPSDFSMSYCTQSYQPTGHSDERMSPFLVGEAASKNGDVPVVPARTDQDQEGNNLPVCAASVSASVANPAAGIIQTSIANRQQSIPVFRQSLGVHLSHFPTNYVPNNQYISPFFIPPPTLHPFLSNATFPQPPSTGVMYPTPGSAGVPPPVKYPVLSFKPGANTGSQVSIGVPGAYGTYGSITSVYTNNTTVPAGNPAVDDDVASAQVKENSIYIAGPQAEGSTLWVPAPGRDVSSLQAYSFYGFTPPGQVTFAPQAVHGPFGGIYHPAHNVTGAPVHSLLQPSHTVAGALEVVGAPGGVYQQPQAQMNWGNY